MVTSPQSLYNTYDHAFPFACGIDQNTYVLKNVTDTDFTQIGTENNIPIFTLTDSKHDLYTLEYDFKVKAFPDDQSFAQMNKTSRPALGDYVVKNPLVFLKDPWGRWIVLGEYDYQLMGGCGKPVVYLYPTKPTNVSVQFVNPVQFTTDIPAYHNEWNVLAHPDGVLTDLQPQYTDCSRLDSTKPGSEYAKTACVNNSYPYLYWAGQSFGASYPPQTSGWIVDQNELPVFLQEKLTAIGLSKQEITDMLAYWVPEMLFKQVPYYRVSFLQTPEMNRLIPLRITPVPDTVIRVFLDWTPLESKPDIKLPPQILTHIERIGFTAVEWGGLK